VEERKCRSVQSAVPTLVKVPVGSSKSVVATAIALLATLESFPPWSMFCVLVIAVGLLMRLLSMKVMVLTTATPARNLFDFLSFCVVMLLCMVAYKKFHKQKVIW